VERCHCGMGQKTRTYSIPAGAHGNPGGTGRPRTRTATHARGTGHTIHRRGCARSGLNFKRPRGRFCSIPNRIQLDSCSFRTGIQIGSEPGWRVQARAVRNGVRARSVTHRRARSPAQSVGTDKTTRLEPVQAGFQTYTDPGFGPVTPTGVTKCDICDGHNQSQSVTPVEIGHSGFQKFFLAKRVWSQSVTIGHNWSPI